MTAKTILDEIKPHGADGYKKILLNHGIPEPVFGVKIEHLKKIQKRVKMDYQLALDLYDTGVYDAQYLAGLIADDARMTKHDLQHWLDAGSSTICGHTVPTVASGSPHGWEMGMKWIESKNEHESAAGWATLSCLVSIKDDAELDVAGLKKLLQRVAKTIHQSPNHVRYQMKGFVISAGCHVKPLTTFAKEIDGKIGKVSVDMGNTACQVPFAPDYIAKVEKRGTIGKKRKSAKC